MLYANPTGGEVQAGAATIQQTSNTRLDVIQHSNNAVINWRGFDIAANEHTNFQQPSSSATALNRVTTPKQSQILGKLTANGKLFIVNPAGIFFGRGAQVDVSALTVSSANVGTADFMAGRYNFSAPGLPDAAIVNEGAITAAQGGLVALVAPWVRNDGVIAAQLGKVALAGGETFTLDLYGDDLIQFAVDSDSVQANVDHTGQISADGGTVYLTAQSANNVLDSAICMDGIIEARSVEADATGRVVLRGDNVELTDRSVIDVSAAAVVADGGFIEVSAKRDLDFQGHVDASAPSGTIGMLLLDPVDEIIDAGNVGPIENAVANTTVQADNTITVNTDVNMANADVGLTLDSPLITLNSNTISTMGGGFRTIGNMMSTQDFSVRTRGGNVTFDGSWSTQQTNLTLQTRVNWPLQTDNDNDGDVTTNGDIFVTAVQPIVLPFIIGGTLTIESGRGDVTFNGNTIPDRTLRVDSGTFVNNGTVTGLFSEADIDTRGDMLLGFNSIFGGITASLRFGLALSVPAGTPVSGMVGTDHGEVTLGFPSPVDFDLIINARELDLNLHPGSTGSIDGNIAIEPDPGDFPAGVDNLINGNMPNGGVDGDGLAATGLDQQDDPTSNNDPPAGLLDFEQWVLEMFGGGAIGGGLNPDVGGDPGQGDPGQDGQPAPGGGGDDPGNDPAGGNGPPAGLLDFGDWINDLFGGAVAGGLDGAGGDAPPDGGGGDTPPLHGGGDGAPADGNKSGGDPEGDPDPNPPPLPDPPGPRLPPPNWRWGPFNGLPQHHPAWANLYNLLEKRLDDAQKNLDAAKKLADADAAPIQDQINQAKDQLDRDNQNLGRLQDKKNAAQAAHNKDKEGLDRAKLDMKGVGNALSTLLFLKNKDEVYPDPGSWEADLNKLNDKYRAALDKFRAARDEAKGSQGAFDKAAGAVTDQQNIINGHNADLKKLDDQLKGVGGGDLENRQTDLNQAKADMQRGTNLFDKAPDPLGDADKKIQADKAKWDKTGTKIETPNDNPLPKDPVKPSSEEFPRIPAPPEDLEVGFGGYGTVRSDNIPGFMAERYGQQGDLANHGSAKNQAVKDFLDSETQSGWSTAAETYPRRDQFSEWQYSTTVKVNQEKGIKVTTQAGYKKGSYSMKITTEPLDKDAGWQPSSVVVNGSVKAEK